MSELLECPQWLVPSLLSASNEECDTWEAWTNHLPKREANTPFHSGPHSVKNFRALKDLGFIYGKMFEIGFCLGHSASAFLELGAREVHSQEISDRPETLRARDMMQGTWRARFKYNVVQPIYDIAYIDGDHSVWAVDDDVTRCLNLGITKFIFDDFYPHWGPGVQPAIKKHNLNLKAIVGGLAACTTY
jgi:hypothetical protein